LLMGGQACVFYGAAEFSRDTDLAILANSENLRKLNRSLEDLQAEIVAVPPYEPKYLRKGHAIHFRCHHRDAAGTRLDVMTRMRGVDAFASLWRRRTTISLEDGMRCELISLPDLVLAKKTQRDKDWPMVRRLVEVNYFEHRDQPTGAQIRFWLQELRTPELLMEMAHVHRRMLATRVRHRPLLRFARSGNQLALAEALIAEEKAEREADRRYWAPLRAELERLRHSRV
jgi:hypothetical protein